MTPTVLRGSVELFVWYNLKRHNWNLSTMSGLQIMQKLLLQLPLLHWISSPYFLLLSNHLLCFHSYLRLPPSYTPYLKLIEAGGSFYSSSPKLLALQLPGITLCMCVNVYACALSLFLYLNSIWIGCCGRSLGAHWVPWLCTLVSQWTWEWIPNGSLSYSSGLLKCHSWLQHTINLVSFISGSS